MYLVADLGNTQLKFAIFDQNELVLHKKFDRKVDARAVEVFLDTVPLGSKCICSSVIKEKNKIEDLLRNKFDCLTFTSSTPLPISNEYESPETLGQDRLANAVALGMEFKESNSLCIDFGTCIKFDFVNNKGAFQGGAISPGLKMKFNSLHNNTDRLPLAASEDEVPLIGKNTIESISSGVVNGTRLEVMGVCEEYSQIFENLNIVFTGGDHFRFVKGFKYPIFARPNQTLIGLFHILKYNETK